MELKDLRELQQLARSSFPDWPRAGNVMAELVDSVGKGIPLDRAMTMIALSDPDEVLEILLECYDSLPRPRYAVNLVGPEGERGWDAWGLNPVTRGFEDLGGVYRILRRAGFVPWHLAKFGKEEITAKIDALATSGQELERLLSCIDDMAEVDGAFEEPAGIWVVTFKDSQVRPGCNGSYFRWVHGADHLAFGFQASSLHRLDGMVERDMPRVMRRHEIERSNPRRP